MCHEKLAYKKVQLSVTHKHAQQRIWLADVRSKAMAHINVQLIIL